MTRSRNRLKPVFRTQHYLHRPRPPPTALTPCTLSPVSPPPQTLPLLCQPDHCSHWFRPQQHLCGTQRQPKEGNKEEGKKEELAPGLGPAPFAPSMRPEKFPVDRSREGWPSCEPAGPRRAGGPPRDSPTGLKIQDQQKHPLVVGQGSPQRGLWHSNKEQNIPPESPK
ncbi:hypothetical protein SKAU_G00025870 [Synaphobranchus kaupii]|uniref:Uncharacterized protein n=1 Tax=Synaphobranchus kaupii TaxID=118154 RepID=A0A9Q1JF64_SYNKA|nr:hypothetical protein SKAU_G00025870 [Synaphobranchus kaupii]